MRMNLKQRKSPKEYENFGEFIYKTEGVAVAQILVTSQSSKVFLELFENIFAVRMIWVTLQRFTYRSVAALKVADLQTPKIRRSLLGLVC